MATNRDIIFTVKVRNQVKGALSQAAKDFKDQAKVIDQAARSVRDYRKAVDSLARPAKGLNDTARSMREIAKQTGQINDRKVTNLSNALGNLAKNATNLNKVATNLGNLNRSFNQTRGLTSFTAQLVTATTQAQALATALAAAQASAAALGRTRGLGGGGASAGGGAGAGGAIPPTPNAPAPRARNPGAAGAAQQNARAAQAALNQAADAALNFENAMTEAAAAAAFINGPLGGLASRITALDTLFRGLGGSTGLLVLGLSSLFVASLKAVTASGELEDQQKKLQAALNSTSNQVNLTVDQIEGMISTLAGQSLLDDNAIRQGAIQLLTFRNISTSIFEDVLKTAADLEAKGIVNLQQAVERLGRAMEDPANALDQLQRSGVRFNATEERQIAVLVRNGKVLEAQKFILDRVKQSFAGLAQAGAGGLYGALNQLSVAIGNFFENLGKDSGLLELVTDAIRSIARGIQYLADNMKTIIPLFQAFGTMLLFVAAQKSLPFLLYGITGALGSMAGPLTTATTLWKNYAAAQALAKTSANGLVTSLAFLPQIVGGVGSAAARTGGGVGILGKTFAALLSPINLMANVLGGLLGRLPVVGKAFAVAAASVRLFTAAIARNPLGALLVALTTAIGLFAYYKDTQVEAFGNTFKLVDLATVAWERFKKLIGTVVDAMSWLGTQTVDGIQAAWDGLQGYFSGWLGTVAGWFKSAINFYIGTWVLLKDAILIIVNAVAGAWDGFLERFKEKFSLVFEGLNKLRQGLFSEAGEAFSRAGSISLFQNFEESAKQVITEIKKKAEEDLSFDWLGASWEAAATTMENIFGGAIKSIYDAAIGYMKDFTGEAAAERARIEADEGEKRRFQQKIDQMTREREALEANVKKMNEFLDKIDEQITGQRVQIQLADTYGKKLELQTKLVEMALEAQKAGLFGEGPNQAANIEMVRKKMQEYVDQWKELDKLQRGQAGMLRGIKSSLDAFVDSSTNTFERFGELTTSWIDNLSDKWVEFTQTGTLDWKGMLNSMAADLQRFAFRYSLATIFKQFMGTDGSSQDLISQALGIASKASTEPLDQKNLLIASQTTPMHVIVAGSIVPTAGDPASGGFLGGIINGIKNIFSPGPSVSPSQASAPAIPGAVPASAAIAPSAAAASVATAAAVTEAVVSGAGWQQTLRQGLTDLGLNPQQVAGAFGGLFAESRLNPTAVGPSGDYGIAQYMARSRVALLNSTAASMGTTKADPNAQVATILTELKTTYAGVVTAMKATTNAADAAEVWIRKFEIPDPAKLQEDIARARAAAPGFVNPGSPNPRTSAADLPAGVQIVPTSDTVDPALLKQMQQQFAQQQYESMSQFFGKGGPRDSNVLDLNSYGTKLLTDTVNTQMQAVSQTVTDAANRTTEAFKAVPQQFMEFPPLVQETATQLNETFRDIPKQLTADSLGISTLQDQVKSNIADAYQYPGGQLKVVDPTRSPSLAPAQGQPYGMLMPATGQPYNYGNIPQSYGSSPSIVPTGGMSMGMDSIVSFTQQFSADTQSLLAPLQASVEQVATTFQTAGQGIQVAGQTAAGSLTSTYANSQQVWSQLDAMAAQSGNSLMMAGTNAQTAAAGVTTLGTSATTAAPQVQTLGTTAQTAAQQQQAQPASAPGGGGGAGFGGMFSQIFSAVGGMLKGTIGKVFGIFQQLFGSFQQLLGGLMGGGGLFGGLGGLLGGLFHTGGVVGETIPQQVKLVSKAAASFAPRYHSGTGLRPDERLAVLQTGELVISRPEAERLRGMRVGRVADPVPDWDRRTERGSYAQSAANMPRGTGRNGGGVVVKQYITTPDPAAFNASQGQIARQTYAAMDRMNRRNS